MSAAERAKSIAMMVMKTKNVRRDGTLSRTVCPVISLAGDSERN